MTLKELLEEKGIKHNKVASVLELSKQSISRKLKADTFTKNELQILISERVIDLQDLEKIMIKALA